MNFSSIKEYFYKLYNVCYLFVLLPLIIFIFIYYQQTEEKIISLITDTGDVQIALAVSVVLALINLTTVHLLSRKRARRYSLMPGLGSKLDGYYEVIFLRFAGGSISSLLMAIGLLLTGNPLFGAIFFVLLILLAIQWPTSRKACRELRLKGDEYKMVFFKTEQF